MSADSESVPLQYREIFGLDNFREELGESEPDMTVGEEIEKALASARDLSPLEKARLDGELLFEQVFGYPPSQHQDDAAETSESPLQKAIHEVACKIVDEMLAKDASGGKLAKSCACKAGDPIAVGDLVRCGADNGICRVTSSQNGLIEFVSLSGRSHGRAIGKYVQRA